MTPGGPRLGLAHDGPEDGARAMARDEVLVDVLRAQDDLGHLFRDHGWQHPTITLGRAQPVPDELVLDARRHQVEIVRRPTGGGWLLHLPGDIALTLAVRGPLGPGDLRRAARSAADAIARGISACGRAATVFGGEPAVASRADVCFMRADKDEVTVGETKVAGVALARFGRAALVQCALPLVPAPRTLEAFADRWDPRRRAAVDVSLRADVERLWAGAAGAMGGILDAASVAWEWPGSALQRAEELRTSKYQAPSYTLGRA